MSDPKEELNRISRRPRYLFIMKGDPSEEETIIFARKLMELGHKLHLAVRPVDIMPGTLLVECHPEFVRRAEQFFPDQLYKVSPQSDPKPQPAAKPGAAPKKPPAKPKPPGPGIY